MKKSILLYSPLFLFLIILMVKMAPQDGLIGHDYSASFIRLVIGAVHFWQNGLRVPHFTPSLCGGIPFIADPQSLYYSLPQWLTFVIEPWKATLLSIAVFYVLGYLGTERLTSQVFHWNPYVSHITALLFETNGVAFGHLYAGHLTFLSYLLFPCVLFCLFESTPKLFGFPFWRRVGTFSCLILCTLYGGGAHVLVLFVVGILLLLPVILHHHWKKNELVTFFSVLLLMSVAVGAIAGSKILLSLRYSRHFYFGSINSSYEPAWTVILRYFWFLPGMTPPSIPFGEWDMGAWEYVGFLSRITLPLLVLFVYQMARSQKPIYWKLIVLYLVSIPLFLFLGQGTEWNTRLPLLSHYHNPIRFLGALVPAIVLAAGASLHRLNAKGLSLFLSASLFLLSEFSFSSDFFVVKKLGLGFRYTTSEYDKLRELGKLPPVTSVTNERRNDLAMLLEGITSINCYEPIFGYRGEKNHSQLTTGSSSSIREGKYNLNHPGCFLYPEYFHCDGWDRIPATPQGEKLFADFSSGKPVDVPSLLF